MMNDEAHLFSIKHPQHFFWIKTLNKIQWPKKVEKENLWLHKTKNYQRAISIHAHAHERTTKTKRESDGDLLLRYPRAVELWQGAFFLFVIFFIFVERFPPGEFPGV